MKRLAVVALFILIATCRGQDTTGPEEWPRTVEPRLTGLRHWNRCEPVPLAPGKVVPTVRCEASQPTPPSRICDEIPVSREQAVKVLLQMPQCLDTAIDALARFAGRDPKAASDLAAAYYVRAQKNDDAEDVLRAMQAILNAPRSPESTFNRALIEEALGLNEAAIASWDSFLKQDRSEWSDEARAHREALLQANSRNAAKQWQDVLAQLPAALARNDRQRVASLIAPFPTTAGRYIEGELTAWATAPTDARLQQLLLLTEEYARVGHEPFARDVVNGIANGSPTQRAAIIDGLRAFNDARLADAQFQTDASRSAYERAAAAFARAGSPMRLRMDLGIASDNPMDRSIAIYQRLETGARDAHYGHLLVASLIGQGFAFHYLGRHLESLSAMDTATTEAQRLGDPEAMLRVLRNRSGYELEAGKKKEAWRTAFSGIRHLAGNVELQSKHDYLGNTQRAASGLGYPAVALLYQETALRLLRAKLGSTPPEQLPAIRNLRQQLAVALRERADLELRVNRVDLAEKDLDESARLVADDKSAAPNVRKSLEAAIQEIRGRSLLSRNPAAAAAAFTRAWSLITDYPSFRASLLAQRAGAYRLLGRTADVERDLRASLDVLREEELTMLHKREVGKGEQLWSPYFSRFEDTYERLIRLLIEQQRYDEALAYAERARAFEPLDLVLRRPDTPTAFRALIAPDGTPKVAAMRAALPPGTFILEYLVLKDVTYTWIVSRDAPTSVLAQRATHEQVARWTQTLQNAARQGDVNAFDDGLKAPYAELIAKPVAVIRGLPGGAAARVVIVPDGPMQGLPFAPLYDTVTHKHLIEMTPVAVDGSAALYLYSWMRDRQLKPSRSALLVGNPTFERNLLPARGLAMLPRAEEEVGKIAALYAPTETLIGPDATIDQFLTRANGKAIVHVAAHAIADAQAPWHSMLLLAPSKSDTGVLDAQELLTRFQSNETRLVVLSACSSAGGLPVGPEGVGPLVRPLIAAGVPAVIGSLWDVEDATAEELLVSFHRHYGDSSDAAVALQLAQIELLNTKNPGFQSALAWGSFQVIGYAAAPSAPPAQEKETSLDGLHSSHSLQRPHGLRSQSGR